MRGQSPKGVRVKRIASRTASLTSLPKREKLKPDAVSLYLESVHAAGEEKEFMPRPAPLEEWLKYSRSLA